MSPDYPRQLVQEHLEMRVLQLHEAAQTLPHGDERESLLDQARRLQDASTVIDRWMSSPGLRSPR